MRKRNRKRSKRRRAFSPGSGIPVDDPGAPIEGDDAGSDSDLREQYIVSRVRGYRALARRQFQQAQRLLPRSRHNAESAARAAIDSAVRAFWWAEGTTLEDAEHVNMHRLGRWTRRTFGCELPFDGTKYEIRCPIRIAHKRIGNSIGFIAPRICSICGRDLAECPHVKGRSYWVRGGPGPSGRCPVCLAESGCRHRPDRLYRVSVVGIIREGQIREISIVGRPADPEARMFALPVDTERLAAALGDEFRVGMPVNCDLCLGECGGIEDPFAEEEQVSTS